MHMCFKKILEVRLGVFLSLVNYSEASLLIGLLELRSLVAEIATHLLFSIQLAIAIPGNPP